MSLADDYRARAIAFKVKSAQAQQAKIIALINNLAAEALRRVDGNGGWGAGYLHLDLTSTNQETIDAVSSKYGRQYLMSKDLGFQVETPGNAIIIRWAKQEDIEAAVEEIMNPKPIVPTVPEVIPGVLEAPEEAAKK